MRFSTLKNISLSNQNICLIDINHDSCWNQQDSNQNQNQVKIKRKQPNDCKKARNPNINQGTPTPQFLEKKICNNATNFWETEREREREREDWWVICLYGSECWVIERLTLFKKTVKFGFFCFVFAPYSWLLTQSFLSLLTKVLVCLVNCSVIY